MQHNVKNLLWLFCFMTAHLALSYTLPADYILSQLSKQSLLKSPVHFQGAIAKNNDDVRFLKMTLGEASLSDFPALNQLLKLQEPRMDVLVHHLKSLGIAVTQVSQGFHANEPVFIIGALPNHPDVPQLWIDKTDFVPIKIVTKNLIITFDKWMACRTISGKKFPAIIKTSAKNMEETISMSEYIPANGG